MPESQTKPTNPDDLAALIQAARADPGAFGRLYLLYVQPVYRYLRSRTGSAPEAEDLTSQTFLAAFESFNKFRADGHFAAWLFSIARHKVIDHYRGQKNAPAGVPEDQIAAETDPLADVIRSERAALLTQLIQALPEEESELLRLRFLAEMSFPEIAHLLGRNPETVKKSYYRLLARLQSQAEARHA